MKDKQGKHDHKLTKLLKFGLFATLMVAPLFAVLFKCMYVTFNKNAYQSYSGENNNQVVLDETSNLSTLNRYYFISDNNYALVNSFITFDIQEIENAYSSDLSTNNNFRTYQSQIAKLYIDNNGSVNKYYSFRDANNTTLFNINPTNKYISFTFKSSNNVLIPNDLQDIFFSITNVDNASLDNAFYYSINEMQNNSLFNWTTSTAIYTPINAMTNGLGITTDAVAILLTYWLYLTLIYIVIDIVVELFTWLTHTIMGKPIS